jgi:hypothetical protein
MPHVELPRPLEDYFALAETERRGDMRRFTITLPYLAGTALGRLQWWWRVSAAEENVIGEAGLATRRARESERFRRHIERWLANTDQRLYGDEPIPRIAPVSMPGVAMPDQRPGADEATTQRSERIDKVVNG